MIDEKEYSMLYTTADPETGKYNSLELETSSGELIDLTELLKSEVKISSNTIFDINSKPVYSVSIEFFGEHVDMDGWDMEV